jgi:hypothetical protein
LSSDLPDNLEFKFDQLNEFLKTDNRAHTRLKAQGINVLRVIYPPRYETDYLQEVHKTYPDQALIDLSDLFVEVIDQYGGIDEFERIFEAHASQPEKLFQTDYDGDPDLLDLILEQIEQADKQGKIPFLLRTGVLYGTGIQVNQIVENQVVVDLDTPLVIFYPAQETEGEPRFLNIRPTSDYRGQTI